MRDLPMSTIAQILFGSETPRNFAVLVGEMDRRLDKWKGRKHRLVWECCDLVIFEFEGTRLIMADADPSETVQIPTLTLSVGPSPDSQDGDVPDGFHERLISLIVEWLQANHRVEAIIWQQVAAPVTPEDIDGLVMGLPGRILDLLVTKSAPEDHLTGSAAGAMVIRTPPVTVPRETTAGAAGEMALASTIPAATDPVAKNHETEEPKAENRDAGTGLQSQTLGRLPPGLSRRILRRRGAQNASAPRPAAQTTPQPAPRRMALTEDDQRLQRVRNALYDPSDVAPRPSNQIRLTTHAMNATLIMVSLPLGSALFTYNLLRGEDMQLSARAMALTGTVLAVMQSPFGS